MRAPDLQLAFDDACEKMRIAYKERERVLSDPECDILDRRDANDNALEAARQYREAHKRLNASLQRRGAAATWTVGPGDTIR